MTYFVIAILIIIYILSVNTTHNTVYLFWMPGCGHCTRLLQGSWIQVRQASDDYNIVEVQSGSAEAQHAQQLLRIDVPGYPYIVKHRHKKVYVYDGDRSASDLIRWCRN